MRFMQNALNTICEEKIQHNKKSEERILSIKDFFERQDKGVGGRKETPIGRLAVMYESLGEQGLSDAAEKHMSEVIRLAFDQHLDNPEQYVSHGFDHTLNVMDYTRSICENNPNIIAATMEKYGVSEGLAKFILENVALFHDFGYPETEVLGLKKAAHAMQGAEVLMGKNVQESFEGILRSATNPKQVIKEILESVLYHSADKVEVDNYPAKIITNAGEYLVGDINDVKTVLETLQYKGFAVKTIKTTKLEELKNILKENYSVEQADEPFKGRSVDLKKAKDKILGIEYAEIDILKNPLRGIIRVADNMDMQVNRLSELQRNPIFRKVYHDLGEGNVGEQIQRIEGIKKSKSLQKATFDEIRSEAIDLLKVWLNAFSVESAAILKQKNIEEMSPDDIFVHVRFMCSANPYQETVRTRKMAIKELLNEAFSREDVQRNEKQRSYLTSLIEGLDERDFEEIGGEVKQIQRMQTKITGKVGQESQKGMVSGGEQDLVPIRSKNTMLQVLGADTKTKEERAEELKTKIQILCSSDYEKKVKPGEKTLSEQERKEEIQRLLNDFYDKFKNNIIALHLENRSYSQKTVMMTKKIAETIPHNSSYDLRHFGGCEAIKSVQLRGKKLIIQVIKKMYKKLNETVAIEEEGSGGVAKIGVGEYQIWRAREAYRSLSFSGEKIEIMVEDENGETVDTSFALNEDTRNTNPTKL